MEFFSTEDDLLYQLLQKITGQTNPTVMSQYYSTTNDLIAAINLAIDNGALRGTPQFFTAAEGQTIITPIKQPLSNSEVYVEGERVFNWSVSGTSVVFVAGLQEGQLVCIIS